MLRHTLSEYVLTGFADIVETISSTCDNGALSIEVKQNKFVMKFRQTSVVSTLPETVSFHGVWSITRLNDIKSIVALIKSNLHNKEIFVELKHDLVRFYVEYPDAVLSIDMPAIVHLEDDENITE